MGVRIGGGVGPIFASFRLGSLFKGIAALCLIVGAIAIVSAVWQLIIAIVVLYTRVIRCLGKTLRPALTHGQQRDELGAWSSRSALRATV